MDNMKGAEISLSTQSKGTHYWEYLYRYPRYGMAYTYSNFNNKDVFGYAHALFSFIDIPLYRTQSKFSLNYEIALGLAAFTKTYDVYENPLNLTISSTINVYIGLDLEARYKLNKNNELKAAVELSHYSNGKTKSPNLGINALSASLGWLHTLKPEWESVNTVERPAHKKHIVEMVLNMGGKRDDLLNDEVYLITTLVGDYYYSGFTKYAFGGGFDLFYDESLAITNAETNNIVLNSGDNYQAGFHLGLMARYNKMSVILQAGNYVHANFKKYTSVYSRLGLRYSITDQLLINLSLKAHYAIADYVEWGIGYRFKTAGI